MMDALKKPLPDDEHTTDGPHPTDAKIRKCSVCGYTRLDAPSALMACCGQPMEIIPDRRRHLDKEYAEVDRRQRQIRFTHKLGDSGR